MSEKPETKPPYPPGHPYEARAFRGMHAPDVPAPSWLPRAGAAAVIVLAAAMLVWAVLD